MKNILLVSFLILSLISCKRGLKADYNNIQGRWNVIEAKRDGTATKTLESAFFDFSNDKTVSSNILQSSEPIPFKIEREILEIQDGLIISFAITDFSLDTCTLNGVFGNYQMELKLAKR